MSMVVAVTTVLVANSVMEDFDLDEVKDKTHNGDEHHYARFNFGWVENSLCGLYYEPDCETPDQYKTNQGSNDF